MLTGMELMACQNLAVPAQVMRHIVNVESSANPYAIGVVGGQLVRQPQNLGEALATVHMLDAKGYNYSLGVAQVNRANLGKYGLDSYEKAFQLCPNLSAGSTILAACYRNAGGNWGKAFSCYYSGNFVTGYQDGYVQKVYDSINRASTIHPAVDASQAIPLQAQPLAYNNAPKSTTLVSSTSASYRQAIRSEALDAVFAAAVPAVKTALPSADASLAAPLQPEPAPAPSTSVAQATPIAPPTGNAPSTVNAAADAVFVPQVRGPNDAPVASTAASSQATASAAPSAAAVDQADLRQEGSDAAFVF